MWENKGHKSTKLNIVYSKIKEETESNAKTLFDNTYKKLQTTLLINEAIKYKSTPISLNDKKEDPIFLNLADVTECELNVLEKLKVKNFIEVKLREEIHKFYVK